MRLLTILAIVLFAVGSANAYLVTDTNDFSGTMAGPQDDERDALELVGKGDPYLYTISHDLTFDPEAKEITSATIVLSHYGNSGSDTGELWWLYGGSEISLGKLEESNGGWNDQLFTIAPAYYNGVTGDSWSLVLTLAETTSGTDRLWLDQSVLSVEYSAVPVPDTLLLFGSGLAGLVFFSRKFVGRKS